MINDRLKIIGYIAFSLICCHLIIWQTPKYRSEWQARFKELRVSRDHQDDDEASKDF